MSVTDYVDQSSNLEETNFNYHLSADWHWGDQHPSELAGWNQQQYQPDTATYHDYQSEQDRQPISAEFGQMAEQPTAVFELNGDNLPVWREPTEEEAVVYEQAEQLAGHKRTFEEFEEENKEEYRQLMGNRVDYMGNPEGAMADLKRIKRVAEEHQIECEPPNEETIRLMWETGCILFGRGKPFEDKLLPLLTELERMDWESKKNLNDNGHPIPPNLHPAVKEKVETLKTEQIFAFVVHFQDMPPGVKLTFTQLNDNFPELLNKIIGGFDHTISFGLALTTMWYDLVSYHLMNNE